MTVADKDFENFSVAGDFPKATEADWRRLVDAALKGAPFARLESKTADGLTIEPLYRRASDAYAITGRPPGAPWTVMQRIDHPDPAVANAQAREDIENGATGLMLTFAGSLRANGYGLDASAETIARALDGIALDKGVVVDVDLAPFAREAPQNVAAAVKQISNPAAANIRFGYDPATAIAMSGKIPLPWRETAPLMARLIQSLADLGFRGPFAVGDGRVIHSAGGTEAQELAFALAAAVDYLRALEGAGMPLQSARDAIYFRFAADADQYLTMAKLRAARKLWARIEGACGLAPKPVTVAAEIAWRTMTKRDPYVNMLRSTIAVAAAGLGGADAITVLPHTAAFGLPDALARRIARNTQLVLLEEANLARVADPSSGSGALETITQQLCVAAWTLFQEIEKAGGIWSALETGLVQRWVASALAERQKRIAHRQDILTGTNAFPDIDETPPAVLDIARLPPAKPISAAKTVPPLPNIRLSESFEVLRDNSDRILQRAGARPKIFLATLGSPADFTPRATFARNLFEAGGIATQEGHPDAYKASGAALACLCASDRDYEQDGPAVAREIKSAGARHIYLAGRPGDHEADLRNAGVQTFIYEGCDALATLAAAYDILG